MNLIYIVLAVMAGLCFAIQNPINASLGDKTNAIYATVISFAGGTLILFLILLTGGNQLYLLKNVKFYQLLGGICGMVGVISCIYALPLIQAALTTSLVIVGQLVMSVVIDAFGLLGVEQKPVSSMRLIGIAIIFIGIIFIYFGSKNNSYEFNKNTKIKLGICILVFIAGMLGAVQTPINASLSNVIGSTEATFVSFLAGTLVAIILLIATKSAVSLKGCGARYWMFSGGAFGVIAIFINLVSVQKLGSALQTSSVLLGQLGGSIIIDSLGILNVEKIKINKKRIAGVLFMIIGVLCL